MRRLPPVLLSAAGTLLLTACQPAVQSAVGIGYDRQGNLIAAVSVCDHEVERVSLQTDSPDQLVAKWQRDAPLHGSETWRPDIGEDGHWRAEAAGVAQLDTETEYSLWAMDGDDISQGHVVFRGSDLHDLHAGQVLFAAKHPARVIDIEKLAAEDCSD